MRQSWNVRIEKLINEPLGWTEVAHHETEALAFSPDDRRLAVTVTHKHAIWNTHLLIIDVQSPKSNVRQFDLSGTCGFDLSWNQRGDALLVCGTLIRLLDGAVCVVGNSPNPTIARYHSVGTAYWLDAEHVVRWTGEILNLACTQAGMWRLEPIWRIRAVAGSQGWVVLSRSQGRRPDIVCEYSIVDRASHRALSGWPTKSPCGTDMILAVGAEALCFNIGENITNSKLHCWAVQGGKELSLPKQVRDSVLDQASGRTARVVADQWKYQRFVWLSPPFPQRRAIFDLRSGAWMASWKPRIQDSTIPSVENSPYRCALSARGEYVAESGDGSVELYRIAP